MSWRELLPPWLVIIAGLAGILLLCVSTKDVPITPPRDKYGIVLDAGPSHSSLFIYQWAPSKGKKTGVIRDWSSCPVQGLGVSNYSDSPQKVGKSLEPCLNWAQKEIPAEQHSQTPLYLGATSSTRQLNLTQPTLPDGLPAALSVALKSSPFNFQGAQILSSPKKDAFNWVAVNYVLENFFKHDWRGQLVPSGKGMAGILAVGGTSAQLTAKMEEEDPKQAPTEGVRLELYGQSHHISTQHCPCHGTHQLRSRLLSRLIQVMSEAMDFIRATVPSPDLGQAVKRLCGMSVKELVKESQTSLETLADYCLVSAFIFQLSTKGYTLDWDGAAWTAFQRKMGDRSSGWTLGYLLSVTNTIPQASPTFLKGIEPGVWSLLLILFVVLLTGSFLRISCRVVGKGDSNRDSTAFGDN